MGSNRCLASVIATWPVRGRRTISSVVLFLGGALMKRVVTVLAMMGVIALVAKLTEARKNGKLSKAQRKGRSEAQQKAKAEGNKGKALRAAVAAAISLTPEQQAAQVEIRKLQRDYRRGVMEILTAEQIEKAGLKRAK